MRFFLIAAIISCVGCMQQTAPSVVSKVPAPAEVNSSVEKESIAAELEIANPELSELEILVGILKTEFFPVEFKAEFGEDRIVHIWGTFYYRNILGNSPVEIKNDLLSMSHDDDTDDLVQDFCDKNAKPEPVWPELAKHLPIKIMTKEEISQTEGRFYLLYTLSRIGLNKNRDRAMISIDCYGLSPRGAIKVFIKKDGKWVKDPVWNGRSWYT